MKQATLWIGDALAILALVALVLTLTAFAHGLGFNQQPAAYKPAPRVYGSYHQWEQFLAKEASYEHARK